MPVYKNINDRLVSLSQGNRFYFCFSCGRMPMVTYVLSYSFTFLNKAMAMYRSALVMTAYTAYNKLHESVNRIRRINKLMTAFKKINMSTNVVKNMYVYDIAYFIAKGDLDVLISGDSVVYIHLDTLANYMTFNYIITNTDVSVKNIVTIHRTTISTTKNTYMFCVCAGTTTGTEMSEFTYDTMGEYLNMCTATTGYKLQLITAWNAHTYLTMDTTMYKSRIKNPRPFNVRCMIKDGNITSRVPFIVKDCKGHMNKSAKTDTYSIPYDFVVITRDKSMSDMLTFYFNRFANKNGILPPDVTLDSALYREPIGNSPYTSSDVSYEYRESTLSGRFLNA
ncbi:hypothetical protein AYO21_11807 [Fonsecaea monophora]|uniref:Uncharacterized protein n=1 Tax=Fonsecaea monophora TaxID=254056 RepID=A0A177ESS7_9EURO|nr:hypothetical protein AYO21_11807 [Fonsecaea monophora]OAG34039.1 hypothetical protein AYO21_11807 [Fonsecaea monophora]